MAILKGGLDALLDYLSAHVLTCLVPAFFIAGAIGIFVSQGAVLKYFGAQARKVSSYAIASVSGAILAVCSCTVLPMFAGIYKRGAGLGPAVAFLYSGPAINVLAVIYSARLLGFELGAARAVGAVLFSVVIGLIMAWLFRKEKRETEGSLYVDENKEAGRPPWKTGVFFVTLLGILVFGASKQWILAGASLIALLVLLKLWFDRTEMLGWLEATWRFVKMIFPWLLGGVFVAGILRVIVSETAITGLVGGNGVLANLIASVFGALMYFATLTEVPIIKAFTELGMGKGPALALLLAGPALSLPNLLAIRNIMGTKRTLTYAGLVVIMATASGLAFGVIVR
jgi:uncharacterized membrane protein YraQ (UPF0718 family)